MRIIAGVYGGRRFTPPGDIPARPTTDTAKEGLFNILENSLQWAGLKTLDLFAGTGSISYELASRGVGDLTLVEQDGRSIAFIRKTLDSLGITGARVIQSSVMPYIMKVQEHFDLVFAGPPYALEGLEDLPGIIFRQGLLKPGGLLVLEHLPRNDFSGDPDFRLRRNYGNTVFSIFVSRETKQEHEQNLPLPGNL